MRGNCEMEKTVINLERSVSPGWRGIHVGSREKQEPLVPARLARLTRRGGFCRAQLSELAKSAESHRLRQSDQPS